MAVNGMRNDVRDWLPESFAETKELEWFRTYFATESFVMVSWDGCRGTRDDDYFRLFVDKFFRETPPSKRHESASIDNSDHVIEDLGLYGRDFRLDVENRRDFIGNRLNLYATGDEFATYQNFAGLNEKWLRGDEKSWYYLLPDGKLFRWDGDNSLVGRITRKVQGWMEGGRLPPKGTLVAKLGPVDGPWYYQDPRRLEADLFDRVLTGPSVITDLLREGGALEGDPDEAYSRFQGLLFGEDRLQTCLMISLTPEGASNLHRVAGRGLLARPRGKLLAIAEEAGLRTPPPPNLVPPPLSLIWGQPKDTASDAPLLHIGGGTVDNVAIDEEGQATLVRLVGLSVVLGLAISWLSFRSIGVTLLLFLVGGTAAVGSLALVWWSGSSMDAVLMSMPSLVYVLGISGGVHIVNYYRDTVDREGFPGDPGEAVSLGWKPCVLASFTTALGLASLATSNIVPIRKFGFFSALSVVAALALVFFFLPAGLQYWPPKSFRRDANSDKESWSDVVTRFWRSIGHAIIRRHGIVSAACMALLLFCIVGLLRLNTSVQIMNLFQADAKIIKDYQWLERNLGELVPMELVVRVDPTLIKAADLDETPDQVGDNLAASSDETPEDAIPRNDAEDVDEKFRLSFLERVELVDNVKKAIQLRFGDTGPDGSRPAIVGQALSASTFVPPLPSTGGGTFKASVRGAFSRRLAAFRSDILSSGYFGIESDFAELWRISLRVAALESEDGVAPPDYGEFVGDLKSTVEPVMAAYRARDTILRTIDAIPSRAGEGFRGARVLMLGVPVTQSKLNGEPLSNAADFMSDRETARQQWFLFSRTLTPLLNNAALKAAFWHDPRFEISDALVESVKNNEYDCVVVVHPDSRYDQLLSSVDFGKVVRAADYEFDGAIEDAITARMDGDPVSTAYTGIVPVVYKAQRTLLKSLVESTGWAFVAISVVMIFLLRSGRAGMVSMVPNVFPVLVVFGLMGWGRVIIDIGTMMTASVAMGVAVDDTIHFLTWFRRGLDDGLDRRKAIMLAYDRCATAMTQTTMIAGLGLAVFALSTFTPTQRFGMLMLTLMVAALLGDLIFLPAILAGPFGRVFSARNETAPKQESTPNIPGTPVAFKPTGSNLIRLSEKSARRTDTPH